jgi:hypothetical protein
MRTSIGGGAQLYGGYAGIVTRYAANATARSAMISASSLAMTGGVATGGVGTGGVGTGGVGGEFGQRAEDLAGVLDVRRADAPEQPGVDLVDRRADDRGAARA